MVHVNELVSPFWPLSPMWLQIDSADMARSPNGAGPWVTLRKAREAADLTQEQLADKVGTTRQTIARFEKEAGHRDHRRISREWALKIAPSVHLRPSALLFDDEAASVPSRDGLIPLLGEVAAGRWVEIVTHDQEPEEWLPFSPQGDLAADGSYALRVRGNSMDQVAPDGSMVICRSFAASGIDIQDDDLVIVERLREQEGLREVTMKRVKRLARGGVQLIPQSSDPRWKPVTYTSRKQADELELRVIAAVEFIVIPTRRGRR